MLGKRYLISSFDIRELSAMNAIQTNTEGAVVVKIDKNLVPAMSTITKANCALFQVLEKLNNDDLKAAGEDERLSEPREEGFVRFLRDVCVVSFPRDCDNVMFGDNNQGQHTGKDLRALIYKQGFQLGETEMQSAFAGAGFMREGKELFVSKRFRNRLMKELTLGVLSANEHGELKLNLQDDYALHMSKLLAYIGLAGSSGQAIDELQAIYQKKTRKTAENWANFELNADSVVLVKDVNLNVSTEGLCPYTVKNNIQTAEQIELQMVKAENPKMNLTDGCGLIDPDLAAEITQMQQARKPGYPNHKAYIVRWPFIKGVLTSFDFKKYLETHSQCKEIVDAFGEKRKVEKIKIILPISMVKGLDYFRMIKAESVSEQKLKAEFEKFNDMTAEQRHDSNEVTKAAWDLYLARLAVSPMKNMIITGADSISTKNQTSLNIQTFSTVSPDLKDARELCKEDFGRIERIERLLKDLGNEHLSKRVKEHIVKLCESLLLSMSPEDEIDDDTPDDDEPPQGASKMSGNPGDAGGGSTTEQPQKEDVQDNIQESAGESLDEMVVRFIKEYPTMINHTEIVDTVKDALFRRVMDLALCRITVEGQVRMLIADPFEFLDHIVAETNGVISSHKLAHPVNTQNQFYAPGIEAEEAVLLRCPHLSPLESVVLESVKQPQEEPNANDSSGDTEGDDSTTDQPPEKHGQELQEQAKYQDYLDEHKGIVIAPAVVLSALGGADMDGDRIFVVTDKKYLELVKEKQNAIKELLIKLLPSDKTDEASDKEKQQPIALRQLQFSKETALTEEMIRNWKILPTVTIQGQSKSKGAIKVSKITQKKFIEKAFGCYERSIKGKVGYYSNRATAIALNHVAEFSSHETESEKWLEQLNTLWRLTSFSVAVGLDIDSAKTGYMPKLDPALKGEAKEPALLKFSKVRKKLNGKMQAKYHIALEAVDPERYSFMKAEDEETRKKAAEVTCTADLLLYEKALVSKTFPKGTSAKSDVTGRKKKGKPLPEDLAKAVQDAANALEESKGKSNVITENLSSLKKYDTQRKHVLEELLNQYPLDEVWTLMDRFEATLPTATLPKRIEDLELKDDLNLMKYVVKPSDELKAELEPHLFGSTGVGNISVIYDIRTLILLKALQRWRGAVKQYNSAATQLETDISEKDAWRLNIGGIRKKMRQIAKDNNVNRLAVGKELLRAGNISLLQYILIFFGDSEQTPLQQEEQKPQGGEENVQ